MTNSPLSLQDAIQCNKVAAYHIYIIVALFLLFYPRFIMLGIKETFCPEATVNYMLYCICII